MLWTDISMDRTGHLLCQPQTLPLFTQCISTQDNTIIIKFANDTTVMRLIKGEAGYSGPAEPNFIAKLHEAKKISKKVTYWERILFGLQVTDLNWSLDATATVALAQQRLQERWNKPPPCHPGLRRTDGDPQASPPGMAATHTDGGDGPSDGHKGGREGDFHPGTQESERIISAERIGGGCLHSAHSLQKKTKKLSI